MKRMIRKISCLLLFNAIYFSGIAQNNAIFKGGNADGWNATNFQQNSSSIFKGGLADGWSAQNYNQQAGGNIFKGGNGDGWDSKGYSQSTTSIFKGGNGDGWDSKNYVQVSTGIFKGGISDGWDSKNYVQLSKGIFNGGPGDGWASNYLPLTPVPVNFLYFNAGKKGETAALLNWKTSQEINSSYFDVERSIDAVNFTNIGKVNAAGNSSVPVEYYFTDNHPESGLDYYRLKQVDIDGHFVYTPSRLVRFGDINSGLVKYFPNPTNGILNVELTQQMLKEVKVINITNISGVVLNQFKLLSNTNPLLQLDLSKYPNGVYFVQVKTATVNSVQRVVLQ